MQQHFQQPSQQGGNFNWGAIYEAAGSIVNSIREFSDAAYGMQKARTMAEQCPLQEMETQNGVNITVHVPNNIRQIYNTILTEEQQNAFMDTLTKRMYFALDEEI